MIRRAKLLFSISSLKEKAVNKILLKEMWNLYYSRERIKLKELEWKNKSYNDVVLIKDLVPKALKKMKIKAFNIFTMFDWSKKNIYGSYYLYRMYKSIIGTIKANKIDDKVWKLNIKRQRLLMNDIFFGFGFRLSENERNKKLAGITKSESKKEDEFQHNFFKKPIPWKINEKSKDVQMIKEKNIKLNHNIDLQKLKKLNEPISILDFDSKFVDKLTNPKTGKEKNKKHFKKLSDKISKIEKELDIINNKYIYEYINKTNAEEDIDVNEILEEKGIKIED
jgi:hypothetical protein